MEVLKFKTPAALSVILILFMWAGGFSAKIPEIKFRHFTSEDGLSQNSAYCIIQDKKGFVWIGTETGLNRYDGYSITVFESQEDNLNTLSNGYILSMCKDTAGILWIGTEKGLNRFDPAVMASTRYLHDPADPASISNNRVTAVCRDRHDNIWAGTEYGLNKFEKETGRFICHRYDPDLPSCISSNSIQCIYEDSKGILWIGTEGGGLNRFDHENNRFDWYKHIENDRTSISDNNVLAVCEDAWGVLWIGTERGGLNRFDREKGVFIPYTNDPDNERSISDNCINAVHEDKAGVLWIGTNDGGLNIFDRQKESFVHYINNPDDPNSLGSDRVITIFEDFNGGLWFGHRGGGISIFIKEAQKFVHYKYNPNKRNSLNWSDIRPIYEDRQGIVWIGTDGGGLNRFDREKNEFTHYKNEPDNPRSLSDNKVFAICEDARGEFWVGTNGGGLNKFDRTSGVFIRYRYDPQDTSSISDDRVRDIIPDKDGGLWIATNGGGLSRFDPENEQFVRYQNDPADPASISSNRLFCLYEDRAGYLWIGTFGGGLEMFDRANNRFIHHKADSNNVNSITVNFVLSIIEDCAGVMWIGTNKGLNRFDRAGNRFTHVTKKSGLPDDVIYDILEDTAGHLWMSTNRGLSRFNPQTGAFKNYDVKDGLQSNEFSTGTAMKSGRTGELFFGGVNGFNLFHPDSISENPYKPAVVITDFELFNKPVPIGKMADGRTILKKSITETKRITLRYSDNVFSFDFAALHYVAPENNLYAYMMEGLDKDWNYVGKRRFASYTGLPPGKYVFKVKGSNNDGVWNEECTSLKITMVPPYWQTWWFYTFSGVVVLFCIALLYTNRVNQLKKQKEEDERRRVTGIFSNVLEQGGAAVYQRKFDSDNYDYIGDGVRFITGYDASVFTLSFWDTIITKTEMIGALSGLSLVDVYRQVRDGQLNRWISDIMFKTRQGETRWIRDMATVLRDDDGKPNVCFGILFDITDRKMAELELKRTSEELRISSEQLLMRNQEMEKDLHMAREVQNALLSQHNPQFPHNVPDGQSAIHFSHRYIPASTLAGDFFEIFPVSDHEVGIMIYDVMGHGVRASLLTAYFHGLIEELMPMASDTVSFMKRLNIGLNAVVARFYTGMFATAFYCVANIKTGTLHYTNAGHPMPLLLHRKDKTIVKLELQSKRTEPALGLFKVFDYSSTEYPMADNDVVFFFTDGIFEVENPAGTLYGDARLVASVRSHIDQSPEPLLDNILGDIKKFSNSEEFSDDVCVVAMHIRKAILTS